MTVIDDYLSNLAPEQRIALERIRAIAKKTLPDLTETIGYGMPVLRYKEKYLLGFAAFKHHMSIFPGASPIASTQSKLRGFKTAKGTIQFTLDNPIPDDILVEIMLESAKKITDQ